MEKKEISNEFVSELAKELITENCEFKEASGEMVLTITAGCVTYDVWHSQDTGHFEVMKSVLPHAKTVHKDWHKRMSKEDAIKEIVSIVEKAFDES